MATENDINDLRGALERGLAANITIIMTVLTRQNAVQLQKDRPRIELVVAIGAATGSRKVLPNATPPVTRLNRWNFTVSFKAITAPQAAVTQNEGEADADFQARVNANNNFHAQVVAALRSYASTAAQVSWADTVNFPTHYIAEALRDAGSPSQLKSEEGNEQTTLNYAGQVGVRESAWPM